MGRNTLLLVLLFFSLVIPKTLYAPWIWSPDTGWINEKDLVKESPKAQWEYAKEFEQENDYDRAVRAYKALIKAYPTSFYTAKAQERVAFCYMETGDLYGAFQAYQTMVEAMPKEIDFESILSKQEEIAEMYIRGKKRKLWKLPILPAVDKGVEMLQQVITNAPYSDIAPIAQYYIGVGYIRLKKYNKAAEAFLKCYQEYSESEYAEKALYQAGRSFYRQSRGSFYDQAATDEAKEVLRDFVDTYPNSDKKDKVLEMLNVLGERKAEGVYNIGLFYEKRKEYKAARLYYNRVIEQFPNSKWSKRAEARLLKLKDRK